MALLSAIVTIVFGVLVFALPKFLRFVVGGYLIIIGVLQLLGR
ncbi:DUF3096 domain-containing protein [Candidatus Woesearchaeota archaeon]|nr:DUF3096 domain-containing protein [Candidatus Woesearchaeota archaeon]